MFYNWSCIIYNWVRNSVLITNIFRLLMKTNNKVMKSLIITLTFMLASALGFAQENATITVTVNNVKNNNGAVIFSLHTEETFLKGPGIMNAKTTIDNGVATVEFKDVPEGTYAILALHDENENNQMDFEASGMPIESYGSSNNDMSMGPPLFSSAKFKVKNTNLNFTIRF